TLASLTTLALLSTGITAGCSGPSAEDEAGDLADTVAEALSERTLEGVPLADAGADADASDELASILERVADLPVEVEAGDATVDGDAATAPLTWAWEVGAETWTYETTADLSRTDDDWALSWDPTLVEPSLTEGEVLDAQVLPARRGDILGAGDRPLVTSRDVLRFGVDKTKVAGSRATSSARRLAQLLDLEVAAYVERVRTAGDKAYVEAVVLRESDAELRVLQSAQGIPGVLVIGDQLSLAPTRGFAGPILGTVGEATAEMIEESDGALEAGDVVGISGLQARYEEQLAGTPGIAIRAVPQAEADAGDARTLFDVEETSGEPLRTTLDERAQSAAESALADIGPASALVAIRPSSGEIVAAASGPGSAGYNTATFGQYAPGSTFKVVSALALLRSGLRPDAPVQCPATTTVDGKSFKNYDDYPASALGQVSLRTAIANSCNTAIIGARDKVGERSLAQAAAALGLGVDHDLGFPSYFGEVPPPESETEAAADLIGQGRVLASPMAMATVMASVSAGRAVLPTLLPDVEVEQTAPEQPLTPGETRDLRAMLRAVVTEGSGSFLADVPGEVIAKTGTAEYGSGTPLPTHTWMVAARGDLAVAVFVETGQSGSQTSGPILEQFLRAVD
ncbi:penicillin-binding transpeptidase domain-containing protein, partial [Nocardioides pacificus]